MIIYVITTKSVLSHHTVFLMYQPCNKYTSSFQLSLRMRTIFLKDNLAVYQTKVTPVFKYPCATTLNERDLITSKQTRFLNVEWN